MQSKILLVVAPLFAALMSCKKPDNGPGATAPRVTLEIVAVDDAFDPFVRSPLAQDPSDGVDLEMERVPVGRDALGAIEQIRHVASVGLAPGESKAQATARLYRALQAVPLPPGDRFGFEPFEGPGADGESRWVGVRAFVLSGAPIITSRDVAGAAVAGPSALEGPQVAVVVELTKDAAQRLEDFTARWVERRIAILLDGEIESAPVVLRAISGGHVHVATYRGPVTDERRARAKTLVDGLRPAMTPPTTPSPAQPSSGVASISLSPAASHEAAVPSLEVETYTGPPAPRADAAVPRMPEPEAVGERLVVPGTGVSLIPPKGVSLRPMGPLMDSAGEIIVPIVVGRGACGEDDTTIAAKYPADPEAVRVGALTGTLRHRSRQNGGKFDGWWLLVRSGERCLTVFLTDKGKDGERWQRWRANMLSVEWSVAPVDAERAAGFSPGEIVGMHLVPDVGGLDLRYEAGESATPDVKFSVTASPFPVPDEQCFEALRNATSHDAISGQPRTVPETHGFHGCEQESASNGTSTYRAQLVLVDSHGRRLGDLVVVGSAPTSSYEKWSPRFLAAVRALHRTR